MNTWTNFNHNSLQFYLTITPELLYSRKQLRFQNCWAGILLSAQAGCAIGERIERDKNLWWKSRRATLTQSNRCFFGLEKKRRSLLGFWNYFGAHRNAFGQRSRTIDISYHVYCRRYLNARRWNFYSLFSCINKANTLLCEECTDSALEGLTGRPVSKYRTVPDVINWQWSRSKNAYRKMLCHVHEGKMRPSPQGWLTLDQQMALVRKLPSGREEQSLLWVTVGELSFNTLPQPQIWRLTHRLYTLAACAEPSKMPSP